MNDGSKLVESLWQMFSQQKWAASKLLFHQDFTAEWPQSRERFESFEHFVDMNSAYPGNHTIEILKLANNGDTVITAVYVHADTGQKAFATSFFEIKDGKIWRLTEFWGEPYDRPEWRKKFSVTY